MYDFFEYDDTNNWGRNNDVATTIAQAKVYFGGDENVRLVVPGVFACHDQVEGHVVGLLVQRGK